VPSAGEDEARRISERTKGDPSGGEGEREEAGAEYVRMVADLEDSAERDFVLLTSRHRHFSLRPIPPFWRTFLNPTYVMLCYLHLAADVGL
jgi:hypothetical protein